MTAAEATIGIIGATGWLGGALGRELLRHGLLPADRPVVLNRRGPTADYDAWPGVVWAKDSADLVARCGVVGRLLGVLGEVDRAGTEAELDDPTALSGSGAAYPALLAATDRAAAMAEHRCRAGAPPDA